VKIKCKNCKAIFEARKYAKRIFCSISCSSSFNNKKRKLSKEQIKKITICLTHGTFNHKKSCQCFICKGKRGERFGKNAGRFNKLNSIETRKKISKNNPWKGKRGKNTPAWKGTSSLYILIRESNKYKNWRNKVFKRDNYTCKECLKRGNYLEAHHNKIPFSKLLKNFLNKYNQFNPIKDKEFLVVLAVKWKPFWYLNNGITLCRKCHNKTKKGVKI
jgi:hypothetical protein